MSKTVSRNRRVVVVLLVVVLGMFGFGFVLIPIYRMMANIYGFGGETQVTESQQALARKQFEQVQHRGVDTTRSVNVQFIVIDNSALRLDFHPLTRQVRLNPGEVKEVSFSVKNLSDRQMFVQAIPAVSPDSASKFLARDECDCFEKQTLKPGESREMPVKIVVDQAIPRNMQVLTLSYRLIEKAGR